MKLPAYAIKSNLPTPPFVDLHVGWDGELYVETNMIAHDGIADVREYQCGQHWIGFVNGERSCSELALPFSVALKRFRAMKGR